MFLDLQCSRKKLATSSRRSCTCEYALNTPANLAPEIDYGFVYGLAAIHIRMICI